MRFSSEIRWFMTGSAPADVLEWFDVLGSVTKMPPRTDYYADLGTSTTASVKLRADRLEFKSLCPPPPRLWRFGGSAGFQNHWLKWSGAAADSGQYDAAAEVSQWLAVWKSRSMRRFAALRGAVELVETDGDYDDIDEGCEVELTSLRVLPVDTVSRAPEDHMWEQAQPWWSVAFEAFGEPSRVDDILRLAANIQLSPPPPVVLAKQSSKSYPGWLALCRAYEWPEGAARGESTLRATGTERH